MVCEIDIVHNDSFILHWLSKLFHVHFYVQLSVSTKTVHVYFHTHEGEKIPYDIRLQKGSAYNLPSDQFRVWRYNE